MNKKIVIRIILIIMIVINCVTIFNFSSQEAEKSSNTSGKVIEAIIESSSKTKNLSKEEKEIIKEKITKPIRKTAHFTIYMCLGMLLFLYAQTFEASRKKKFMYSWALGAIYACTDEFHQKFVDGRSCEITDVGIDSLGVLFGILVAISILKSISIILKKVLKNSGK